MKRQLWVIWSHEHKAWWMPNSDGYTKSYEAAGRYSFAEALDICRECNFGFLDCKYIGDDKPPKETMMLALEET